MDIARHPNWRALEERSEAQVTATFSVGAAEEIAWREQFDFLLSSHSLEHHEFPQRSLQRAFLALKPGAAGLLFLPAPWSYFLYGHHGWRTFSPALIETLCRQAGFQVERMIGLGGFPSFLLHVVALSWLETAKIYEILSLGRLHWRLSTFFDRLRLKSLRKNPFSLRIHRGLSAFLLPLDPYLSRPHHAYCVVVRRPANPG